MKALRIILNQNKACYKKEESDLNKMTYPLPPFSTVIGAIHAACGFKSYQPMDISIQGNFAAMGQEVYRDHAFLNSLQNDRGILVKLANNKLLSSGFTKVAAAQKSQGNDFEKEITIEIFNRACLSEYQQIKAGLRTLAEAKKTILDPQIAELKAKIKTLKETQKELIKDSLEFKDMNEQIIILQKEEKELTAAYKQKKQDLDNAYAQFATLTTSIKYYEVLYGVNLILHIKAEQDTLNTIADNVYNIRSLGRSEDFVDIVSCDLVEMVEDIDDIKNTNSAYVRIDNVKDGRVIAATGGSNKAQGTKYYLNKDYTLQNNKRVFNKTFVLYISNFDTESLDGKKSNIYIDNDGYIANFI